MSAEHFKHVFGPSVEVAHKDGITTNVERTIAGRACRKGVQLGKEASIGAMRLGKDAAVRAIRDLNKARKMVPWKEIAKIPTVENFLVFSFLIVTAKDKGYFDTPEAQRIFSWVHSLLPSPETIIYQERPAPPTLFHKVAPGQTLTELSQLYGVPIEKIAQTNGIENIDNIPQGIVFAIPLQDWVYKPFEVEPPQGIYALPWEKDSNPEKIWGLAHYYGAGEPLNENTASGELFNPFAMTAASWFHTMGKRVRVTNLYTGMSVDVRINDRGPNRLYEYGEDGIRKNVVIDLTFAALRRIEPYDREILVEVTLLPD